MNLAQKSDKLVGQGQLFALPNEMSRRVRFPVLENEPPFLRPQDGKLVRDEPNTFRHPFGRVVDATAFRHHAELLGLEPGRDQSVAVVVAQQRTFGFLKRWLLPSLPDLSLIGLKQVSEDCREVVTAKEVSLAAAEREVREVRKIAT